MYDRKMTFHDSKKDLAREQLTKHKDFFLEGKYFTKVCFPM